MALGSQDVLHGAQGRKGRVASPQQGKALAPLELFFHDLGAQIDAVFADVDTSRTGDEPAVPV